MDHEIGASNPGDKNSSKWLWITFIAIFVILLFGFAFLPFANSKVAAQQPGPDLRIRKNPLGDFLIGETGTYSITVSNSSSMVVSGTITVTDTLPDGLSDVMVTASGWQDCGQILQTQIVTCVYSNTTGLAAGDKLPDILISAFVNPITTTQIVNTVSVTNTNDTNAANNIATSPTNVVGADLSVTKSVVPISPSEGSVITYTLTVTNAGPSQATGVVLTDTLPAGVTFQSAQPTGVYSDTTGLWTIGALSNGTSATLRLRAIVDSGTLGKTIVNTTEGLSSAVNDYDLSNNVASASFSIQSTQVSGRVIDAATDDPISGAKVELQDSANRLYSINTAPNGWYTFTNTITTPLAVGSATIRASKTGYVSKSATPFLVAGQNTRQNFSLDTADLLFTKSDGLTTVAPGQTITYTMVVSNVGTIPATSVAITDVLPSALTYITSTLGISPTTPASLTYVWRLTEDIDPGEAVRFKLRVRVADALPSPATAITNQARTTTKSPEANTSNNIAQDTTTSSGTPNPSITISVSPNQIRVNQNATYTILVKNTGTAPMTNVVVDDTFSTLLTITNVTTTKGTATRNNTTRQVTVTISEINPNQEVTIKVVTRAASNPTSNTTITNSAKLTYKFGGSTFTRTSSSVSLQILVSTTLPGTGGIQLSDQTGDPKPYLLAFISAGLLFALSITAIFYAYRIRGQQSEWSSWAVKMGIMLAVVGILFGAVGALLLDYTRPGSQSPAALNISPGLIDKEQRDTETEPYSLVWPGVTPQIPGSELDELPDFPIPTPTVSTTSPGSESDLDLTPVNRVIIPAIALDTVVKYVPFDGITWLIAGLKQEVAWMGDTSWPGLGSNTALAGHVTLRDGSNGPFRYIYDLGYGDAVFVYTEQFIYEYKVRDQLTVDETDLSVIGSSEDSLLTLITCADWDADTGFYTRRYIVHADLVGAKPINRPPQGN